MTTLADLQKQLDGLRYRRAILKHLLEYFEGEFLPKEDSKPAKFILTPEKTAVPLDAIEEMATQLTNELAGVSTLLDKGLATEYVVAPPPPPATQPTPEAKQ